MRPWTSLIALLCVVASGDACERDRGASSRRPGARRAAPAGKHHVRVVRLTVRDRTSPNDQVVRLRVGEMRRILTEALGDVGGFRLDLDGPPRGPKAHAVRVDVELQSIVGTDKGKASVLLSLEMTRLGAADDEPAYVHNALSEKVYATEKLQSLEVVYRDLLRGVARELLRLIGVESRLRTAPADVVVHAIRSSRLDTLDRGWTSRVDVWQPVGLPGLLSLQGDLGLPVMMTALIMGQATPETGTGEGIDVREMSIKAAALRRLRPAVPEILKVLLRDTRPRIQDLCLGALAEIRDPGAVPELTRWARLGDPQRLRKVIGVVGLIGGTEAKAFLEITADGHDDEELQKLARETLARLKDRPPPVPPAR